MGEGPRRQQPTLCECETAVGDSGKHLVVFIRINHYCDVVVVLGRCAHHRGSTDIDLLNTLGRGGSRSHGLGEGVEVHHHQLERLDSQVRKDSFVFWILHVGQESGVDTWMQCLHPTVQAFRESCHG